MANIVKKSWQTGWGKNVWCVLILSQDISSFPFPQFLFVHCSTRSSQSHHDGLSMKEPSVTLCSFLLWSWEPATRLSPASAVMSAGWREKWRAATNVPSLSLSVAPPPHPSPHPLFFSVYVPHAHMNLNVYNRVCLKGKKKSSFCIDTDSTPRVHIQLIFFHYTMARHWEGRGWAEGEKSERMEKDRERVVFPYLTIMSGMSNEGERQRPWHGPAHTGRGGGAGGQQKMQEIDR